MKTTPRSESARVASVHDRFCSIPNCRHKQLARLKSLSFAYPSGRSNAVSNFCFRTWPRRMFVWSQWCAWSSGFRRKVATSPNFLVIKPLGLTFQAKKCDYAPGFFELWRLVRGLHGRCDSCRPFAETQGRSKPELFATKKNVWSLHTAEEKVCVGMSEGIFWWTFHCREGESVLLSLSSSVGPENKFPETTREDFKARDFQDGLWEISEKASHHSAVTQSVREAPSPCGRDSTWQGATLASRSGANHMLSTRRCALEQDLLPR